MFTLHLLWAEPLMDLLLSPAAAHSPLLYIGYFSTGFAFRAPSLRVSSSPLYFLSPSSNDSSCINNMKRPSMSDGSQSNSNKHLWVKGDSVCFSSGSRPLFSWFSLEHEWLETDGPSSRCFTITIRLNTDLLRLCLYRDDIGLFSSSSINIISLPWFYVGIIDALNTDDQLIVTTSVVSSVQVSPCEWT